MRLFRETQLKSVKEGMKEKIQRYLTQLEKDNKIEILLACETGSRAWGFPSPDSDYDIRIIYKHQKDWYLGLVEEKDSLVEFYENNEIDISGWDFRKCLRLLIKSNPALLERIQSPIIYLAKPGFLMEINSLSNQFYSRISTLHHYLGMAKKALSEINELEEYKLKKFFYALRAATACLWILEKEEKPPIEFRIMLDELKIDPIIKVRIQELISLKATISESYLHQGEPAIFNFIHKSLNKAESEAKELPASKGKVKDLNHFFIKHLD